MPSLEEIQTIPQGEQFIYTERPFEYVDKALEEIRQLESGEKEEDKAFSGRHVFYFGIRKQLGRTAGRHLQIDSPIHSHIFGILRNVRRTSSPERN